MRKRLTGWKFDVAIALITLLVSLFAGVVHVIDGELPPYAWLLLTVGPAALALRRRFPRTVLAVTIGALLMTTSLELGPLPAVPALVAIGTAAFLGYRVLTTVVVLTLSTLVGFGNWAVADWQFTPAVAQRSMLVIGWLHVALVTGMSMRERKAYIAEAEHTKAEAVRRKAADERVRIARELHDSLTHSISVIRVQAGVAIHLARKRGEKPAAALLAVEEASKDATRELRETLTMLRDDDGSRLARVKELTDRYHGLGFDIDLKADAECLGVPSEVDHAAYRILQEALTNAVRHSTGDHVGVRLARSDGHIAIEVTDNGTSRPPVAGRGITGMRERVDALGGTIEVGPSEAGFRVWAQLPLPGS